MTNAPLSKVVDYLSKIAEINLYLDPKGLAEEGVTTDTPITIEVRHEIMLKSALNLILQPLHLNYVVKDEVLKITSEQMRDNQVYPVTYNVADLVVPIPNFVPMPMGLSAAYQNAMGTIGFGGGTAPFGSTNSPLAVVASRDGKGGTGMINPNILSQITSPHPAGGSHNQSQQPTGFGPGGLGGGTQADFDSLINLITGTVKPQTWDSVGGPGSIEPFETNLSIVVSQTQDVHEEIVDLLEQLRRMQDLQVTIEVRFITLTDNFFERIGVNFDFKIHDNAKNQVAGFGSVAAPGNPTGSPAQRNRSSTPSTRIAPLARSWERMRLACPTPRLRCIPRIWIFHSPRAATTWRSRNLALSTPRPAPRWDSPSSATSKPTSSSPPHKAIPAPTCCKPPRLLCSTGNRRRSSIRRKFPSLSA